MKIVICTVPLRPERLKTTYPPLGALAIIQALQAAGYNVDLYDINFFRPSEEEIRSYFLKDRPEVVGISAPISTSYIYVKRLAAIIKSVSPETIIIVGGRLAVSSEVLLKFANIDFCVIGEGEKIIVKLMDHLSRKDLSKSEEWSNGSRGLSFLNTRGDLVFTGYDAQPSIDEIRDPDYSIVKTFSDIDNYITSPFIYEQFRYDSRSGQRHRLDKRLATVIASRGCANRCTFCNRWQQGIRVLPVDRVIQHIKSLMQDYNVGFISFGDEDFGVSKRWLEEFVDKMRPLDLLYRISGMCCENVAPPILKKLKESGCVAIHYGFESGSNKMLAVIEKRADVALNVKVAFWTHEAGIQTVPALVVGMPGETRQTIKETTDFVKAITEFLPREPIVSVNLLVSLPGTAVYEYARLMGYLGKGLKGEEMYLERISDRGGTSSAQLNLTDYPYLVVQSWAKCIILEAYYNYYKKKKLPALSMTKFFLTLLRIVFKSQDASSTKDLFSSPLLYHLRYFIVPAFVIYQNYKELDKRLFLQRSWELVAWPFKKRNFTKYVSLRDLVYERMQDIKRFGQGDIKLLRLGR